MENGGPALIIRLKHHTDGAVSLTCTRPDGSTTWQRFEGATAMVFPAHDLTHFSVETTLGYRGGFYGLIAAGWEIGDFAKPWPRGPIPLEAREVELIVGFFDAERRELTTWSAAEFAQHAALFLDAARARGKETPAAVRMPAAEELVAVRHARDQLLQRWFATPPGGELALDFSYGRYRSSPADAP